MSVNKVILIGNLGKDPEMRYLQGGTAICNISIATTRQWKDKNGEQQKETEWHKVVAFGRTAEICGEYLKKGSQVYIEGRLQTRKWQDKETGADRYSTEIVCETMKMLGASNGERSLNAKREQRMMADAQNVVDMFPGAIVDDDVPF